MADDPMEDEARPAALEYWIIHILARQYAAYPNSAEIIERDRGRITALFRFETLGGGDPVQSDHAIAEIETAVQSVLLEAAKILEAAIAEDKSAQ